MSPDEKKVMVKVRGRRNVVRRSWSTRDKVENQRLQLTGEETASCSKYLLPSFIPEPVMAQAGGETDADIPHNHRDEAQSLEHRNS